MGVGHKFSAIVCALLLAACSSKSPPPTLFESNVAREAVAQITAKLHPPVRVLQVEITAGSLSMQVQDPAAPTHVDEYRYNQGDASVSGPAPVQLHLNNPKLEENLFNLEDVNLAAVPEAVQEAIRQTALEGGGAIERIVIKRRLSIWPVPRNGDVQWTISVRGPRETASAYADAQGHVNRLDLSETERAKNVDFTEGGELFDQALGRIRKTFGGDKPVFQKLSISPNRIWFPVREIEPPHKMKKQICDVNGLHDDFLGGIQDRMQPGITQLLDKVQHKEPVTESQCFSLDEIDWSKLPEMRKAAIQQTGADVAIKQVNIHRRVGYASPLQVEWEFITRRDSDEGFVQFDTKGNLLRSQRPLPPTVRSDQLEPENARVVIKAIRDDFGAQTRLIGIELTKNHASVTACAFGHPELGWIYNYSLRDGMEFWSDKGVSHPNNDAEMILADEVLKTIDMLDELKKKAVAQVGKTDAEVERVNFYRYRPRGSSKLLLVEFTMSHDGSVTYDSAGHLVR